MTSNYSKIHYLMKTFQLDFDFNINVIEESILFLVNSDLIVNAFSFILFFSFVNINLG